MWAETSLTEASKSDEAPQLVDHLAAGGDRGGDVGPGDAGVGQEAVEGLGHGPEVAPAARHALARADRFERRLRLGAAVEAVDHFAVGREEHGLERGRSDVDAEEQRAAHRKHPQDDRGSGLRAERFPLDGRDTRTPRERQGQSGEKADWAARRAEKRQKASETHRGPPGYGGAHFCRAGTRMAMSSASGSYLFGSSECDRPPLSLLLGPTL